jgi:hypothetical protein
VWPTLVQYAKRHRETQSKKKCQKSEFVSILSTKKRYFKSLKLGLNYGSTVPVPVLLLSTLRIATRKCDGVMGTYRCGVGSRQAKASKAWH